MGGEILNTPGPRPWPSHIVSITFGVSYCKFQLERIASVYIYIYKCTYLIYVPVPSFFKLIG